MSESPTESPKPAPGTLVVPAHGNGRLRYGSRPGTNRGGAGAPPSELRARLRGSLSKRVKILEEIADSPEASNADRIRAVDILAKYGLGQQKELTVENIRDRLERTVRIIREELPPEEAAALLARLREVWR